MNTKSNKGRSSGNKDRDKEFRSAYINIFTSKSGTDESRNLGLSCSEPDIRGDNCCSRDFDCIKYPPSIAHDCEEPMVQPVGDAEHHDFDMQVTAKDIKATRYVQTSSSLLLRTPELPKRCFNSMRTKVAQKCHECRDCEERYTVQTGQFLDAATQIELWRFSWPELEQTGPSLTAVGPFCRFDYKLRTTKPVKDDPFFDCCPAMEPGDIIICSCNRDGCADFHQQVSSLDINVSELLQTEDNVETGEQCEQMIVQGSCHSRAFYKELALLDCECPTLKDGRRSERSRSFTNQVTQTDICPSKLIQTDLCLLLHKCRKSRLFQNKDWNCECGIPRDSRLQNISKAVNDFGQQVTATDIGGTEETQTCLSLSTVKLFCAAGSPRALPRNRGTDQKHVLIGRARSFKKDACYCCSVASKAVTSNASTQVRHKDISVSRQVQTDDQVPNLTKCYVRGSQWTDRTRHYPRP